MRTWGVGILPMGWAKLFELPAEAMADRFCDGGAHPAFAALAPLLPVLSDITDMDEAARTIGAYLTEHLPDTHPDDATIREAHLALIEGDLASVHAFAIRLGLSQRSVERLCRRAFGFAPKLLLRRQRFLRSLARFMLDPSMAWIDALDHHYHDQAQFSHDFRRFMGMNPRAYALRPKPVLGTAAVARAAATGAAVQGLHRPTG